MDVYVHVYFVKSQSNNMFKNITISEGIVFNNIHRHPNIEKSGHHLVEVSLYSYEAELSI